MEVKSRLEELIIDFSSASQSKEEREAKVATGLLTYKSKLLKTIWFTNINDLTN